ncbi:hypothetical protein GAP32_151 [Cronobacter phage vB_CsaM_GAP32]|uniref:Uncharacterized protein n=1 Tax=Cronobacter phage vB_CsaM_GAP32 TaxID=1141136 RepID=K4F5V1_9CAUD|nr:hypothetical protein GAP32_151 [Cronobacter phage vB_CsaM_GAP32]AFC21601.1 hypothetical protein GAP32_151 [Cronobacter phage vB_CsaM_GAP32]
MNRITLTFLLLRKNVKQIREFLLSTSESRVRSSRRKYIIGIKEELAKLSLSKYNLIKAIATNFSRFEIKKLKTNYVPNRIHEEFHTIINVIDGTDIEVSRSVSSFYSSFMTNENDLKISKRGIPPSKDPWVIYDNELDLYFLIYDDKTIVDDVELFTDSDHEWFISIYRELQKAKEAEDEIMKQQQEMLEKQRIERKKEGILSKYS